MNNRLKIICVLFAVTYLFIILHVIFTEMLEINIQKTSDDNEEIVEQTEVNSSVTYIFDILPLKKSASFPTISIENLKTGKPVDIEVRQFSVQLQKQNEHSLSVYIFFGINLLVGFLKLFIVIYIPVQTFKIVKSISRNVIFDTKNIRRIRNLGYTLIILFSVGLLSQYLGSLTVTNMLAFKDYEIISMEIKNTSYLLFGFVSLLFAEILKISLKMKEEQDFTI